MIPRRKRPVLLAFVAVAAGLVLAATAVVLLVGQRTHPQDPAPTHTPSAAALTFDRPGDWSTYRPAFHLTPENRWMNDPQRPFFLDGVWHYYYLFNADYPEGNGTSWYHATSTDLVHWRDEGVAIEKYRNGLGDIETGSAVIDEQNTAGFGKDAVIAIMTQQDEGVQRQSLFVSTDGGFSFTSYDRNPVLDNPGSPDFRDPKIVWDDTNDEWIMVLAEGRKIGFYTSPNLTSWTYVSGFERDDLGTLECPDLFQMSIDGDPEHTRWVLAASAHGSGYGRTTGLAYWTGSWDGRSFTADANDPQWLDSGSDFYAAVSWEDPRQNPNERLANRFVMGWMNNWAYAGDLPTTDWRGGIDSVVRRIQLTERDGILTLTSEPTAALRSLEGTPTTVKDVVVDGDSADLPQPTTGSYRLRTTIERPATGGAREVRLKVKSGGGHFVTVGYDFENERVFLARDTDAIASSMPEVYRDIRWAHSPIHGGRVDLDILVDYSSVEVFAAEGTQTLSSLAFGSPGANGLSAEAVDGAATIRSLTTTPVAVAEPIRR